jgi:uncharacterized repeat protein (TIGR01451 family)
MTALAKPAAGQAATDPQFGTTIRRISAAPSGGVIKPMYSTISAWNADETKLILYRVGQGHLLYDGKTYQLIRSLDIVPADLEQVYWHTSDPDVLFYVDGNRFIRYHVSTAVKDTLTTFTFCSAASGGSDPMYISWDSRRIGLGCGGERFIYDMSTNTVVGRKTMSGGVPQIAPSGNLAFLDGKVVDTSLNTLRTLALGNPWEHASLGRLTSGHDTYNGVGYDGPEAALATFDLTDGTSRVIVGPATGYPYPPSGIHVSAMAYKRPGWVALSVVGNPAGPNLLDSEIVLADTNPGGKVCRVAHHRSWGGDGSVGYWAEPHAVPSPSGTRILFGSDWGNSGTVDAFVVELPAYSATHEGDLSLAATASPSPVADGASFTYTITVRNAGTTSVTGVSLAETLPAGVTYASASTGCTHAAGRVTCALGTLAGGATRTVTVTVSAEAVGTAVAQLSVSGTPSDPDTSNNSVSTSTPVLPTVSISDATVTEGNSGTTIAELTVSLSGGSTSTVSVVLATGDGTATAGSDYDAASGTLSFSPGSVQRTVSVAVGGDTTVEANETFVVNVSSPTNAFVADGQGQVTITNDDAPPPSGEPVSWVNVVGASPGSGSLTKTAAAAWGNSGASSGRAISANGQLEFVLPAAAGYVMLGLSNGDSDQGYADIDFALYTYPSTGQLLVYEKGTQRGSFGTYAAGDTLRVAVASGVVRYYRNGALLYTSAQVPTLPLRVDASLYSTGATVSTAVLSGTLVDVASLPSEPVSWVNLVGASVSGVTLTKTAATGWTNAGAASGRALNGNGYAEFTVPTSPGYAMFGLGSGDTDQGYADVDYAFYTYPGTGQLMVYEKGVQRGQFGAYAAGDKLRISVESGVVKYWWKGVLVYTSGQVPTLPLRVDTSLYSTGAVVQGAILAGTLVDLALPTEAVVWQNAVGVSSTSTTLTKTAATAWGNAGASSTRGVPSGSAGYAEFTVPASPGYAMLGLGNGDTDQGYADVDFAFYVYPATGQLMVFEKGVYRTSLGAYAAGDTMRISVDSGVVRYWWKGVLAYTSTQVPTFPLRVDTSLYSTGAVVQGATLGGSTVATP